MRGREAVEGAKRFGQPISSEELVHPLSCQPYRAKFRNLCATIDFYCSYAALFPLAGSRAPQSSAAYACPTLPTVDPEWLPLSVESLSLSRLELSLANREYRLRVQGVSPGL